MIKKSLVLTILLGIGSMQMLGDILNLEKIQAIGFATCASPRQKVFTSQNGYETFSADFEISYTDINGANKSILLTPKNYKYIKGPYNRRNMYGAGLSYAPVLVKNDKTKNMFVSVSNYALCGSSPLLSELNIKDINPKSKFYISLTPKQKNINKDNWILEYEVNCHE